MEDVFNQVVEIIKEQLEVDSKRVIDEQTSIVDDLGADSLEIMEIVMAVEQKFNIKLPEDEMAQLSTVGDVVKKINEQLGKS